METTILSDKGQVIIPKTIRIAQNWQVGQEFEVVLVDEGILMRPKAIFSMTTLDEVAGCLKIARQTKSSVQIEAAMKQAAKNQVNS